jgi:hypothetical protein
MAPGTIIRTHALFIESDNTDPRHRESERHPHDLAVSSE